jgi:cell division protein FtsL
VTEVALFGGFDDNTFFDPDKTATEYGAMRTMVQSFAGAARLKAYRDLIAEAEKKVKAAEKEKEKLEKSRVSLQSNTSSNLARIEDLKKKNLENRSQMASDSVALLKNAQVLEESRVRLQRRRDRLSALDRKN